VPEVVDRRCGDAIGVVDDRRETWLEWWELRVTKLGLHYIRALGGPSLYDSFNVMKAVGRKLFWYCKTMPLACLLVRLGM
jgi:hypothetical protein